VSDPKTPAGARARAQFQTDHGSVLTDIEDIDFDKIAQAVLDRVERERSENETIIEGRIADALARELTLITMDHEWWVGLARTVLARADINLQEQP